MAEETNELWEEEPLPLKRVSEVSEHSRYEGQAITIDEILDEDVVILAFQSRKSQFEGRETYLAIQVEHEGVKKVISTGSGPIIDALDGITPDQLPLIARFVKQKSKAGRRYYSVF